MNGIYANQQWIYIAVLFLAIFVYIIYIRYRDRQWIAKRFGPKQAVALSFGVNYFGRTSEPGKPRKSSGFLILLPDRLFYRSRFSGLELDIPGKKIARVYPGTSIKGVELHQSVMIVDFLNEKGNRDSAAFKVPYPPQWIRMIENIFDKQKAL